MKQRILSLLFAIVLVCCIFPFSNAETAAISVDNTLSVSASNRGKRTKILLQWIPLADIDGVQIYRSETGKRGSFQKLVSVRGASFFFDSGLKSNHIYYYKIRPFTKTSDGNVFGKFSCITASTALTESFLLKKLHKAQTVANAFLDNSMPRCKNSDSIIRSVETDDGLLTCRFFEVNRGSIRTIAGLKKYLRKYFSSDLVDFVVNSYYCEYKGRLYQLEGDSIDPSYILQDQTSLQIISQNDLSVSFKAVFCKPDLNQEKHTFASFLGAPEQKQRRNKTNGRITVNLTSEDWNLTLVNKQRQLPRGYAPQTTQILNTGYVLDYRVTPYYEEMYRAAQKDGCYLTPFSTYRSYQYQKMLFQNFAAGLRSSGYSASEAERETAMQILYPGTSEHQLGFAIDIKGTGQWFAQTKEYRWLKQHAHEYGFIERYTADKRLITGIIPEPWHWRYVGMPWAQEIRDSGLCLEEYLALKGSLFLREKKLLTMKVENGKWVFDFDEKGNNAWGYGNYSFRKSSDI